MDIFLGVRSSLVGVGGQKLDNQGSKKSLNFTKIKILVENFQKRGNKL